MRLKAEKAELAGLRARITQDLAKAIVGGPERDKDWKVITDFVKEPNDAKSDAALRRLAADLQVQKLVVEPNDSDRLRTVQTGRRG